MAMNFVQAKVTSLFVSISASETTEIKLKNLVDVYGNELSMTDFGDIGYITIDPRGDNEEIVSFTDFTVNSDSTVSIDTGITRGLAAKSPYGATGTASAHAAGVLVVVSNNPQMYDYIIDYIDGIAIAGAPNASTTVQGLVEQATQAEVDAKTETGATGAFLNVNPSQIRSTKYNDYVADSGIADAYVITPDPAITAYAAGQEFTFKAGNANTGASTLNVNGLGAKSIFKEVDTELGLGDILENQIVRVAYDGTNFQMLNRHNLILNEQVFTSTDTWTNPKTGTVAKIEIWGAGGGGGAGRTHGSPDSGGGGGGGGAKNEVYMFIADLGDTETVTIGAGGAGGASSAAGGSAGGTTSFGTHAYAYGGGGGAGGDDDYTATGGAGGGIYSAGESGTISANNFHYRNGGAPRGKSFISVSVSGNDYADLLTNAVGFGGGSSGYVSSTNDAGSAEYGGGAGGNGDNTAGSGGDSVYGGGGGGGGTHTSGGSAGAGGGTGTYSEGNGGVAGTGEGGDGGDGADFEGGGGGSYGAVGQAGAGGAGGIAGGGGGGGSGDSDTGGTFNVGGAGGDGYAKITVF